MFGHTVLRRILYGGEAFEVLQFMANNESPGGDEGDGSFGFLREPEMALRDGFWNSPPCPICGKIVVTSCNYTQLKRINQMRKRNVERWQTLHGPGICFPAQAESINAPEPAVQDCGPSSAAEANGFPSNPPFRFTDGHFVDLCPHCNMPVRTKGPGKDRETLPPWRWKQSKDNHRKKWQLHGPTKCQPASEGEVDEAEAEAEIQPDNGCEDLVANEDEIKEPVSTKRLAVPPPPPRPQFGSVVDANW